MLFIIEQGETYAVVKTFNVNDHIVSKIIAEDLTLDSARNRLVEDGVPMNAASAGQVAGIGIGPQGEPPGRRRKLLRRIKRMCVR